MIATQPTQMEVLLAKRELMLEKRRIEIEAENQIYFYRPHEKQRSFHEAASFHYRYGRTGNRFGKPLAHYEIVVTANGLRRISEIQVGDIVFDHQGRPTKVTGVFPQGQLPVYRFHFDDETTLDACEGHLWLVKSPKERWFNGDWIVRSTAEILQHVGFEPTHAKQRYVIPLTAPVQFPERELPLDPYVLGAFLGDGSFSQSTVTLTSWDEEIIQNVIYALPKGTHLCKDKAIGHYHFAGDEWENTGAGRISTNTMPAILSSLGLERKDSYTKFIPPLYLLSSVEQRQALLQGLMDTDGTVDKNGLSAEYTTCSSSLAQGFQFLCQSLGLKVTVKPRSTFDQNGTHCLSYRCGIRQPQKNLFRLSRKSNLVTLNEGYEKQRVIYKIEKLEGEVPCFCIAVDSPHKTFLATNCIVTHNSEMGAAEDVAFALGFRPWVEQGNPLRTLGIPSHPTKGLIVTTDWDKSTEVFTSTEAGTNQGKLFKYIPKKSLLGVTRNHSGAIDMVRIQHYRPDGTTKDGVSVIHLDTVKSFKQNPLGQESSVWDWIHYDEPPPEAMFKAQVRGTIDRGGRVWFTCTPLTEPWVDAMFIPDLEDHSRVDVNIQHGDFWMMTGSTYDNPYNKPEDIKRVMDLYTDEERATRETGIPSAYAGLVYKEFEWAKHVGSHDGPWASGWTPPPDACIRIAVDYHFRKNDAVLFVAITPPPEERIYVFHEIWKQLLVEDETKEIKAVLTVNGVERDYQPVLMEPLADTPNKVTDITPMDEYRRCGLAVLPATKDPVNGIRSVKALLKMRDKKGNAIVQINPACRRFLFEISRGFIWDGEENKPIKKNDDMMENLYRLALHGLSYVEPSVINDYVILQGIEVPPNVLSFPDEMRVPFSDEESINKTKRYAERYRR